MSARTGVPEACGRQARFGAAALAMLALLLAPAAALAQEPACHGRDPLRSTGTLNLRVDNDMFGGVGQDQGYSNGFLLSWVTPNLVDHADDPCLPGGARKLNRYLAWLNPAGFEEQNMTIGLGQAMYTPSDPASTALLADDRPYAGVLMFSVGYNARKGDRLRTSQLRMGIVGPAALARQTQSWWHDLIGVERFHGWHNQLRNEVVLQLIHERRLRLARAQNGAGWGWDATGHLGASLGNFATYANGGAELRVGLRLPDDFGTAPLRPAGENTSPIRAGATRDWSGHLLLAVDLRWVLHDITLDGNTFRHSHRVDKEALTADLGYGAAVYAHGWRLAFTRYHRAREFRGQKNVPVYGTITVGRRF